MVSTWSREQARHPSGSGATSPRGLACSGQVTVSTSLPGGRIDAFEGLRGTEFSERDPIVIWPVSAGETNNIVEAPDGHLLVGISAPSDHCKRTSDLSAAIIFFRPDGTDLSIRAPFGFAYHPGTSYLIVTINQRDDLGSRTPGDWLAAVKPGENWGFRLPGARHLSPPPRHFSASSPMDLRRMWLDQDHGHDRVRTLSA